jgi:hypothetical protein
MSLLHVPSLRGADAESKSYQCSGVITQLGETTLEITELPIRKWTQDYKEWLETLIKPEDKNEAPLLVDYKEAHTDQKVWMGIRQCMCGGGDDSGMKFGGP